MAQRTFTDEQEQEICGRYAKGESTIQLAATYEVSPGRINRLLKSCGVAIRSRSEALGGIPAEMHQEICSRYLAGESTLKLAKAFKAGSTSIRNILGAKGIDRRPPGESNRKIPVKLHKEIIDRYLAGESMTRLGLSYGVSIPTVASILDAAGVARRSASEAHGGLPTATHAEVCNRYLNGESTVQIAESLNCCSTTIGDILDKNEVAMRSNSEAQGGIPASLHSEVCARYLAGEHARRLGRAYGVSPTTVVRMLQRHGITRRASAEYCRVVPLELHTEICARYTGGENTIQLGSAYGVRHGTIGNILKRCGIQIRAQGAFGDNVQDVLDGTGNHSGNRECELYVFSLARYGQTHCKVGIAFDTDARVRIGQGEYGEECLRLCFSSRRESLFLEQAVLDATRGCADCPPDLEGWDGASEVRAMPADDMVQVVLRLADELEELGVWEFAARYVPMTAAQRLICQQRAMAADALTEGGAG